MPLRSASAALAVLRDVVRVATQFLAAQRCADCSCIRMLAFLLDCGIFEVTALVAHFKGVIVSALLAGSAIEATAFISEISNRAVCFAFATGGSRVTSLLLGLWFRHVRTERFIHLSIFLHVIGAPDLPGNGGLCLATFLLAYKVRPAASVPVHSFAAFRFREAHYFRELFFVTFVCAAWASNPVAAFAFVEILDEPVAPFATHADRLAAGRFWRVSCAHQGVPACIARRTNFWFCFRAWWDRTLRHVPGRKPVTKRVCEVEDTSM